MTVAWTTKVVTVGVVVTLVTAVMVAVTLDWMRRNTYYSKYLRYHRRYPLTTVGVCRYKKEVVVLTGLDIISIVLAFARLAQDS